MDRKAFHAAIKQGVFYLNYLIIACFFLLVLMEIILDHTADDFTRHYVQYYEKEEYQNPLKLFPGHQQYPFEFDPALYWRNRRNHAIVYRGGQAPVPVPLVPDDGSQYFLSDSYGFIPNREGEDFKDILAAMNPGDRLYFMLGGSAIQPSEHTGYDRTLPALAEAVLQTKDPNRGIRIVNAGVAGYHLCQDKAYAFNELLHYEPAGFVFYGGLADIWAARSKKSVRQITHSPFSRQLTGQMNEFMLELDEKQGVEGSSVRANIKNLIKSVFPYTAANLAIHRYKIRQARTVASREEDEESIAIPEKQEILPPELALALQKTKMDLIQSAEICRALGIQGVFVLQPSIFAGNKRRTEAEEEIFREGLRSEAALDILKYYHHYETLYRNLGERYESDPGIQFLVLTDVFDEVEVRVYQNGWHLMEEGNRIVAEEIARRISGMDQE